MKYLRWPAALCLVLATAACGALPGEPVSVLEVRTDATSYVVGDSITVRIDNASGRDAYFSHCDHGIAFTVEARRGAGWEDAGGVGTVCPAIYESGVMAVRSGRSHTRTFALDRTGTFRVRVLTGHHPANPARDILYSNTFTVE